ncbi:HEAT repeat domain-containing protein [Petrachloros mirabilis]
MLYLILCSLLTIGAYHAATAATASNEKSLDREAGDAFNKADYASVLKMWQSIPPDAAPSKSFLRLAFQSALKLGHADDGLTLYERIAPPDQRDDFKALRQLSMSFLNAYVRDSREYIRIAAYTTLADLGLPETQAILEDGLLDSSPMIRARAAEGIDRAGLAAKSGPLRRALLDEMPPVRIAAMNALSTARVVEIKPRLIEVARTVDGPEAVFAYAALYKLGKQDSLRDITGATTLPDPETRMAAFGVLGTLKQPSSLAVLSQGVYDPDPSVRAFAAGALGDFGKPGAVAPLTHALGDESARVRGVAAASLGRLGIRDNRPLLHALTRDASLHVRAQAVEGLLRLSDTTAILVATDLARHPDPSVRAAAAQALGAASDKQAISVLQILLQDQQPQPRLFAAKSLGKVSGTVIPLLKKGLHDSEAAVRLTAAGSLIQQIDRMAKSSSRQGRKG